MSLRYETFEIGIQILTKGLLNYSSISVLHYKEENINKKTPAVDEE